MATGFSSRGSSALGFPSRSTLGWFGGDRWTMFILTGESAGLTLRRFYNGSQTWSTAIPNATPVLASFCVGENAVYVAYRIDADGTSEVQSFNKVTGDSIASIGYGASGGDRAGVSVNSSGTVLVGNDATQYYAPLDLSTVTASALPVNVPIPNENRSAMPISGYSAVYGHIFPSLKGYVGADLNDYYEMYRFDDSARRILPSYGVFNVFGGGDIGAEHIPAFDSSGRAYFPYDLSRIARFDSPSFTGGEDQTLLLNEGLRYCCYGNNAKLYALGGNRLVIGADKVYEIDPDSVSVNESAALSDLSLDAITQVGIVSPSKADILIVYADSNNDYQVASIRDNLTLGREYSLSINADTSQILSIGLDQPGMGVGPPASYNW